MSGWAYAHPILGLAVVILTIYLGMRGLQSTHRSPFAPAARRIHTQLAPWVYALCALAALLGLGSTWTLRTDLEPASTAHGAAGAATLLLMSLGALLSRRTPGDRRAARAHRWVGLLTMVAALSVAVLGMRLLP